MARTFTKASYISGLDEAVLPSIPIVTSVAAIKSDTLNPDDYPIVRLRTNTRDQEFEWLAGDYTTRVAADIFNGRYIKKDSVSAGTGAWVALPHNPTKAAGLNSRFQRDTWHYAEFDVPVDIGTDASPYITALHNLANIDRPGLIQQDAGIFSLYSQLPAFTYQVNMKGVRNGGFQSSILYKRYHESGGSRGVLHSSQWSVQYEDINIQADAALASGGVAFGLVTSINDSGAGDAYLTRCRSSMGDGVNYTVLIDGLSNANSDHASAGGNRHIIMTDCIWFGAAIGCMRIASGRQVMASNLVAGTAGGSSSLVLAVTGTSFVKSDNIFLQGAISGDVDLNYLERGHFLSYKQGALENTANTTRTMWVGPNISGITESNWTDGSVLVTS